MPVYMNPSELYVKNPNGNGYLPQNTVSQHSVEDVQAAGASQVSAVNSAGATQVAAINTKAGEVTAQLANAGEMEDMVAGAFSTSKAYKAGDYVIYTTNNVNKLYRFNVDHAAGAWNSAQVSKVKLGDETSLLKSAIRDNKASQGFRDYLINTGLSFTNTGVDYVVQPNGTIEINGTATAYRVIKVSNTVQARSSIQSGWPSETIFLEPDREYALCVTPISGTFSGAAAVNLSIYDSEKNLTAYAVFADNNTGLYKDPVVAWDSVVTSDKAAYAVLTIREGATFDHVKIRVELIDRKVFNAFMSLSGFTSLFAGTFSNAVSYRAGQYVVVNENNANILYRFAVNHDAGEWVGTDAVKIPLGDDVTAINDDCSMLHEEIDEVRPFEPYIDVAAEIEPGTLITNGENGTNNNAYRRSAKWVKNKPFTSISVIGSGDSFTIVAYGKMADGTVESFSRIDNTYHALVDVPVNYDSFRFVVTVNNATIKVYRSNDAKKEPVNTVYKLPLVPTNTLSDGQFVGSSYNPNRAISATYFRPYKNTTLSIHTEQNSVSVYVYKYSGSCVFIDSASGTFDNEFELDGNYLYRFVFYKSGGVGKDIEITIKKKIYKKLELDFVYGGMNGAGTYVENPTIPGYVCRDGISTNSNETLFVKVKEGYDAIVNALAADGNRENVVIYDDFSITGNQILFGFRRRDEGEITGDYSDALTVYSVKRGDSKAGYDWTVAAPNSFGRHKIMADIVCEGIGKEFNTQFVLQCCINQIDAPCSKVFLYPGDYELDSIKENPVAKYGKDCFGVTHSLTTASGGEKIFSNDVSPDRSFGTQVCLCIASPYANIRGIRKIVQIDGFTMGEPQDGRLSTARIRLVESLWDSLSENDDQVSILCFEGNRSVDSAGAKALLHMSNVDFYGKDAVKPVVFVDAYYVHNVRLVDVNVYARGYTPFANLYGNSFASFTAMPSRKNVGFRLSQGDPYGRSKLDGCHATGLGVGFDMTSEHYIFENCHATRCKWGFCFGDYNGRESTQHNILMLKCSISQCMKSIRFNRFGYDEGVLRTDPQFEDDFFEVVRENKLYGRQNIQIIDLSMGEPVFFAEGFIGDDGTEYVSGVRYPMEGFHEVNHGYISWKGKITVQKGVAVSQGCKGFEIRNLDNNYSGSLSDRPTSKATSPVYDGTEFIDIDNNDVYKFIGGSWVKLLTE